MGAELVIPRPAIRSRTATCAFTLPEIVVSLTIMTILVGAMVSAMVVASHAFPQRNAVEQRTIAVSEALEWLRRDLSYATVIHTLEGREIAFEVPDRGHGSAGDEMIRYSWSGSPGDPLLRRYNNGSDVVVCPSVDSFSMTHTRTTRPLTTPPHVLLVTHSPTTPRALARRGLMLNWGFTVTILENTSSAAMIHEAAAAADVVYLPQESTGSLLGGLLGGLVGGLLDLLGQASLWNPTTGVVTELPDTFRNLGLSSASSDLGNRSEIEILINSHEITAPFSTGSLTICSNAEDLSGLAGTLAPGGVSLARHSGNSVLFAVELNEMLYGGAPAAARRVKLPWAEPGFEMGYLNDAGQTLMRRAIVWAAAPVVCSTVRVSLRASGTPTLETEIHLINLPRAPRP